MSMFALNLEYCSSMCVSVCQRMRVQAHTIFACIVVIFLQATRTPDIRKSMKKQDGRHAEIYLTFCRTNKCVQLALEFEIFSIFWKFWSIVNRMRL